MANGARQVHRIDGETGDYIGVFASGFTEPTAILYVPEPTMAAMLAVGALAAASRRRAARQ